MIIDKIELVYKKFYLPLKIKYSETRKVSFMEFLILAIIIDYPDKNKSLEDILKEEFNIKKLNLFERTLYDLKRFGILELSKDFFNTDDFSLFTPLKSLIIDKKIVDKFKQKDYYISQDDRLKSVYFSYDPLMQGYEVTEKILENKKLNHSKLSVELNIDKPINLFNNPDHMLNITKQFMINNQELFGEKVLFKDLMNEHDSIIVAKDLRDKSQEEKVVTEIWVEFINREAKINGEDQFLLNYFSLNKEKQKEFILSLLNKYSKKISDLFVPRPFIENKIKFNSKFDLISNINIKSNWNMLLVNGMYISSSTNFLNKSKQITNNVDFIVFYNSKENINDIDIKEKKYIAHLGSVESDLLNENNLIYVDSDNIATAYAIAEEEVYQNFKLPVIYSYKDNLKLELEKLFNEKINKLLENYEEQLINNQLQSSSNLLHFLSRLNLTKELETIFIKYLSNNLENPNSFNNLSSFYKDYGFKKELDLLEKSLGKLIISESKDYSTEEIIKLLSKYYFINKNNLINLIEQMEFDNSIENIFKINKYLETQNIDGWKQNIQNSLIVLLEYFIKNNRKDLLNKEEYKSSTWQKHSNYLNLIANITFDVYQNKFKQVELMYNQLLLKTNALIKDLVNIKDYDKYLINLSQILKEIYKPYYKYQTKLINDSDKNLINIKAKIVTASYLSKKEKQIDSLLSNSQLSMPIEIKLQWAKYVENKRTEVENFIKDDTKIVQALNILFGEYKEYNQKELDVIIKKFKE